MREDGEIVNCHFLAQFKVGLLLDGDVIANLENMFKYIEDNGGWNDVKVCDESLQKTRFVMSRLSEALQTMQENHIRHNGEI
jgi:hypothetical protein